MIPPLDEYGLLPPGVHVATIDEVDRRFGRESELRRVQMESLRWLVDAARRVGIAGLIINGSFVTEEFEPNDVDCVLLIGTGFPRDMAAEVGVDRGAPVPRIEFG